MKGTTSRFNFNIFVGRHKIGPVKALALRIGGLSGLMSVSDVLCGADYIRKAGDWGSAMPYFTAQGNFTVRQRKVSV